MTVHYEVWLDDGRGNRVALLDGATWISFLKAANSAGGFSIGLPFNFDERLINLDSLVEIWREPEGGALRLVFVGFVRQWYYEGTEAGDVLTISGPGVNELLSRRIVAYAAGSAYADKTDFADDMMKTVVKENLGASVTDADRNLTAMGLTVEADVSLGQSITKAFAYKPVLEALQGIAEASRTAGTEVYFDLAPGFGSSGLLELAFTTYTGQIGKDRRADTDAPVYFGPQWGNLGDPTLLQDYSEEVTVAYAGGQGEGSDRVIAEVEDADRTGSSAWNRREGFQDARNDSSTAGVTAAAQEKLAEGRPRLKFSGKLLDTEKFRYGVDWDFGDRVTCEYRGMQFDGMVRMVQLAVDEQGVETLDVRIEVEG